MAGYPNYFGVNNPLMNNAASQPLTYGTNIVPNYQYPLNNVQQNVSAISGRVVNSENEITANEVPMDGRVTVFPLSDFSCVYLKGWDGTGNIKTMKFVPEEDHEEIVIQPNTNSQEIIDRLDNIEKSIEKLTKRNNYHKNYKKQNKVQNGNNSEEA